MSETSQFLIRHGLPLMFLAVLIEQFGVPIPALPLLLAAGALAAAGKFNLFMGVAATAIACLIADASWFYLGKYRGNRTGRQWRSLVGGLEEGSKSLVKP